MKSLQDTEAAYIAAFIDGEGSIGVGRSLRPRHEPAYSLNVHVDNTVFYVLKWMQVVTGLGHIAPKERVSTRHKRGWTWKLRNGEIESLLWAVLPFLRIKQAQAELMLEFLRLENFHTTNTGVPMDVSITRKLIWEELAELNRRGT